MAKTAYSRGQLAKMDIGQLRRAAKEWGVQSAGKNQADVRRALEKKILASQGKKTAAHKAKKTTKKVNQMKKASKKTTAKKTTSKKASVKKTTAKKVSKKPNAKTVNKVASKKVDLDVNATLLLLIPMVVECASLCDVKIPKEFEKYKPEDLDEGSDDDDDPEAEEEEEGDDEEEEAEDDGSGEDEEEEESDEEESDEEDAEDAEEASDDEDAVIISEETVKKMDLEQLGEVIDQINESEGKEVLEATDSLKETRAAVLEYMKKHGDDDEEDEESEDEEESDDGAEAPEWCIKGAAVVVNIDGEDYDGEVVKVHDTYAVVYFEVDDSQANVDFSDMKPKAKAGSKKKVTKKVSRK